VPLLVFLAVWTTASLSLGLIARAFRAERLTAGLMLGLARGFDTGMKPPFEQFPMKMTSPRDYVRQQARAAGASVVEEQRTKSGGDGITDSGFELR